MSRPRDYFECPQHPDVPEIFFQLAMAADDWSPVYFDPRRPDVAPRRAEGAEDVFPEIVRWIDDDTLGANPLRHLDYEDRPTPEFERFFDPAEFLLACHLRHHIGQWVEDAEGWPFTFQYIPVDTWPEDDDAESTPVGWMLALTSFKPSAPSLDDLLKAVSWERGPYANPVFNLPNDGFIHVEETGMEYYIWPKHGVVGHCHDAVGLMTYGTATPEIISGLMDHSISEPIED